MARKKGEVVTLYCEHCRWSTELPLARTEASVVLPCSHCHESLYWHCCASCGLGYAGAEEPKCPICDEDEALEQISFDGSADH